MRSEKYIYNLLNGLLQELVPSSYYSFKPGTKEDGFEYYDMQLQTIRNEIDSHFRNQKEVREKLCRLVDEEEILIKSYSQPGAPERWVKVNPKLKYYDCVFDIIEECPEIYNTIKTGDLVIGNESVINFSFYPTEEECKKRKEYFAELMNKSREQDKEYSIDRFYQSELIDTLRMIFEAEFM